MKLELKNYNHNYYCSDTNYYSRKADIDYCCFEDYWDEWHDADQDYNLIFRWDIYKNEDEDDDCDYGEYYLMVHYMLQRKGKFVPITVKNLKKRDLPRLQKILSANWEYIKEIWHPITGESE